MEQIVKLHIEKLPEGTLKAILRQAGITTEQFLNA
jgi:predicted RNA binding protein YcfA (HicA-like mRNA interferase family)